MKIIYSSPTSSVCQASPWLRLNFFNSLSWKAQRLSCVCIHTTQPSCDTISSSVKTRSSEERKQTPLSSGNKWPMAEGCQQSEILLLHGAAIADMAVERKNPPWFSVAVMRERTDKQAVSGPRFPRGYSPLGLQQVRLFPHLCLQTMVLQLNHQPGTKASSEERDFQSEVSVFWSALCTSVLCCSKWVPSIMATEDGWTPSAFPPCSKAMLTTLNFLCHLICTRSKNKSSCTVTGISC